MPGPPRISVIVPVHNGQRFIAQAIESIRRQPLDSREIIIVDDGSTDGTRRILERDFPDCRYLFQEQAGPAAARNAGLQAARGERIGFLDSDDQFSEHGLSSLDAALTAVPHADIAMGMVRAMQLVKGTASAGDSTFEPVGDAVICYNVGSMLVRRAVFDRIGPFNTHYWRCEDVDWFMRAQEIETPFEVVRDVVLHYRRHDANMSLDHGATAFDLARVLKASLDRRRRLPDRATRPVEDVYYVRPGRLRV